MQHNWVPSTLGHGNKMCNRCWVTDLEAAAIGMVECDAAPKPANENAPATVSQEMIDDQMLQDDDGELEQDWEDEANCGRMSNGQCSMAGSEYCDWSCPFGR